MTTSQSCGSDVLKPTMATLVRTDAMTAMERLLDFQLDGGRSLGHKPGQFVEISIPGVGEAPISVSSAPSSNGSFELVVRRMGNVTRALHNLKAGDTVGIRGPFGTHFPVETMRGCDLLFICGGIGLVPVRSAINDVLSRRRDYGKITILFGAKTPAERLFTEEAPRWAAQRDVVYQETVDRGDEGWKGHVGVITTLMPNLKLNPANLKVIICGPPIMYKFVLLELEKMRVSFTQVYVSLERHMKCGVGKCGHCQINGFYACQDGPVFKYSDISKTREAI